MTDDLLERLRELPGAARAVRRPGRRPRRLGGGRRGARRAARTRPARPRSRGGGRRRGGRAAAGRRRRSCTSASAPPPRRARSTSPRRAASATSARVRCRRSSSAPRSPRTSRAATSRVNAIAVRLADGELEAVPGGLEDLAARRLRVLHERSFLDDPTRLLRLVRYAARLRFQIEEETREWAFAAVEGGALATVTPARLGAELRLLLRASRCRARPAGWRRSGSGPQLCPGLRRRPGPGRARAAPDAGRRRARTSSRSPPACSTPRRRRSPSRLDAFEFPARERDVVVAAATRARALAPVMGGLEGASGLWALLRREAPETVALAGALGAPEAARRWLEDLRHRRLAITGDDLLAAGLAGPAIGRALDAATAAMLDGEADGPRGAAGGGAGGAGRGPGRGPPSLMPATMRGVDLPTPFPWRDEHIGASLPGGEVLFSTRRGGVSEGPFASLNLGRLTDDPGENVDENRARLAAAVGAPRERFLYGRQVHEATVRRATEPPGPQRPHAEEDGQATALDGRAGARVRRRLPAGHARRRRRGGGAARRLARAGGRDRGRGRRGAARARRRGRRAGRARPVGARLLLRGRRGGPRGLRRLRRPRGRAEPRSREGRPRSSSRPRASRRSTTSGCARCAPTTGCSSPTAATAASPGGRRGSCGGPDQRPRARDGRARGRARAGGDRRGRAARGPRPGRGRAARRRQVHRARGARRARGGRADAARREPRAGARGQGGGASRLPLALHRPAPEPQGQADPPVRRADPLGRLGLRAQAAREARHARDGDPRRGQRGGGGGQGRHRPGGAPGASSSARRCGSPG